MIAIDTLVNFFLISCLLGLAPGPDNIYVLSQSALRGKTAGFAITSGLCTGLLGHTLAVALGLAALLATSPKAFLLLKIIGAGYLLWLAWQSFRTQTVANSTHETDQLTLPQLYRRGILMNISNPKVSIFFLAFLPQFIQPQNGFAVAQTALLGIVFICATLLVFGSIAIIAGLLQDVFHNYPKVQLTLQRTAGALFAALALKLLITN